MIASRASVGILPVRIQRRAVVTSGTPNRRRSLARCESASFGMVRSGRRAHVRRLTRERRPRRASCDLDKAPCESETSWERGATTALEGASRPPPAASAHALQLRIMYIMLTFLSFCISASAGRGGPPQPPFR